MQFLCHPCFPQIINGQFVEGFYIYSREMGANGTYKMLTVLHGGGASACTMTGLAKYRQYEFFIVPFYKSVEGRPSNSRVARTLEDGKPGAVISVIRSVNVHLNANSRQSIRTPIGLGIKSKTEVILKRSGRKRVLDNGITGAIHI